MVQKSINPLVLFIILSFIGCKGEIVPNVFDISEELKITKLTNHSFIHTSNITLKNGSKFQCNGFVYLKLIPT